MQYKQFIKLKQALIILTLFIFSYQNNAAINKEENYFFTFYSSQNNQTLYNIYINTPFSEFLTINQSEDKIQIKKEKTNEYTYKNISSVLYYENEFLIKTCFGPNKLMEIIPLKDIEANPENQFLRYSYNLDSINNIIFCYTTTIINPDKRVKDEKAIITFFSEIEKSKKEYSHKILLFFPNSLSFSEIYSLYSDYPSEFAKEYPFCCTNFRETDIYCTINDQKNHFIIETNNILKDHPNVFLINNEIFEKNMKPLSLNNNYRTNLGQYFDTFILEYHNKEKNETKIMYSLYRKKKRLSLIPFLDNFENNNIFKGINIKDDYIDYNIFNNLLPLPNEVIFSYIYNNFLYAIRVDYSSSSNDYKYLTKDTSVYYRAKIKDNCNIPKLLRTSYKKNYIKYNNHDQFIVNNKTKKQYIFQNDIEIMISCENDDKSSNITYISQIIEMPQCLIDLDSINGLSIHKIDFYLDRDIIIYDIFSDPKLKSFRNVGILFHQIESHYAGLLFFQIKTEHDKDFFVPRANTYYLNVTHLKFQKIVPNFTPILKKKFYFKYRIMEFNYNNDNKNLINRITSNLCSFEIRFIPFNYKALNNEDIFFNIDDLFHFSDDIDDNSDDLVLNSTTHSIFPKCEVDFCLFCPNYDSNSCEKCDTLEIPSIILDNDTKSQTFGKCICNPNLGLKKNPNSKYNICTCKDNYYYYKSLDECWPKEILENGSYYIRDHADYDDLNNTHIYDDCDFSCKACNITKKNCLGCKDGYFYINNDTSNCYEKSEIENNHYGYFNKSNYQQFIECGNNCINCNENNCLECKNGYKLDERNKSCELINNLKIWFILGEEKFYFYKESNCSIIFNFDKIFLLSNKEVCQSIFPNFKNSEFYTFFQNKSSYKNYIAQNDINEYNNRVNIIEKKNNITFQIVNIPLEKQDNLSYIHIEKNENDIKSFYNISNNDKILLMKADIKKDSFRSTQVEYKFYHPKTFEELNLTNYFYQRRLRGLDSEEESDTSTLDIDIPIDWPKEQKSKIDELIEKKINPFNSSSEFYIDNCNQYTDSHGKDIFLEERKIEYYPNFELFENNCIFDDKYNSSTGKITCKCKYKENTDNYKNVYFLKKEVDPKFKEKNVLENLKTMKCVDKIFKPENLKKNIGFIILILFTIIFVVFGLLYYLTGGLFNVKEELEKIFESPNEKKNLYIDKNQYEKENNIKDNFSNSENNSSNEKGKNKGIKIIKIICNKEIENNDNNSNNQKSFDKKISNNEEIKNNKESIEKNSRINNEKEDQDIIQEENNSNEDDIQIHNNFKNELLNNKDSLMNSKINNEDSKENKESDKKTEKSKYENYENYSMDSKGSKDIEFNKISNLFDNHSNNANPPKKSPDNNSIRLGKFSDDKNYSESERRVINPKNMNKYEENSSNNCSKKIYSCLSTICNNSFKNLYIEQIKKHHLIFYTFFNFEEKSNLFLKISFFTFSIQLYFGLNTLLTFDLSMAESYIGKGKAKPGLIAINLFIPFVICGIISFIIKIIIMPEYFLFRIEKENKNNKELKQLINKNEERNEKLNINSSPKTKKHSIKNNIKESNNSFLRIKDNDVFKSKVELYYINYKSKIICYFIICFLIMVFNWYMMTSFCSIYRNTGVKLLLNSFISVIASFIIYFILCLFLTILKSCE